MSKSFKKTPISGNTTHPSEKQDKRVANRKLRRAIRQYINIDPDEDDYILPILREVSNVWSFAKDGKRWRGSLTDYEQLFKILRK